MTLNDLERQFTAVSLVLYVLYQTPEARILVFAIRYHYSSAIYIFSSTMKLIGNSFEFQA